MKLLLDMLKSTLFRKKDFHITFLHLLDQIVAVKHRKKDKFYIHTRTLLQSFICRIKLIVKSESVGVSQFNLQILLIALFWTLCTSPRLVSDTQAIEKNE